MGGNQLSSWPALEDPDSILTNTSIGSITWCQYNEPSVLDTAYQPTYLGAKYQCKSQGRNVCLLSPRPAPPCMPHVLLISGQMIRWYCPTDTVPRHMICLPSSFLSIESPPLILLIARDSLESAGRSQIEHFQLAMTFLPNEIMSVALEVCLVWNGLKEYL